MRRLFALILCSLLGLVTPSPQAVADAFPVSLPLPAGFYPEGVAVGGGTDFYVGSLVGGAVYAGDLRTGEGSVVVSAVDGRLVAGITYDPRSKLLWGVGLDAGAPTIFAFDPAAGALVQAVTVPVTAPGGFLNDLTVTRTAIYVTDSLSSVLWVLPLSRQGLPSGPATSLPLTGDFEFVRVTEPSNPVPPINLNGIAATRNGRWLLAVHSTLGVLYRIDPRTGRATEVDLGGASLASGDGLVLQGKDLYVVQNFLQQVAVVALDPDFSSGQVTDVITSQLFRTPTTGAVFGSSLYLVNARFAEALPPIFGVPPVTLDYDVVRVPR